MTITPNAADSTIDGATSLQISTAYASYTLVATSTTSGSAGTPNAWSII
jgi:hypothetical protein